MLSLDLFDSRYEKRLHEGAVDDAEYARLKKLGQQIDYLKQARAQTKDADMHRAIDQRIQKYDEERREILSVRGMKEAEQPQRSPAKGLLKGKDLVTPQQRVAGATPQKPGVMGAVKDVVGGIKRFVKGEPDQGPTYEQEQPDTKPPLGPTASPQLQSVTELIAAWNSEQDYIDLPLADGSSVPVTRPAIFNSLVALKQVQTNRPKKYLEYVNKNLADKDTFFRWLANVPRYKTPPKKKKQAQLGLDLMPPPVQAPAQQPQPEAPSGPMVSPEFRKDVGLSERKSQKKKFKSTGIKDVRLSRELQKARAQYPTAGSDIEAFAKAQMDANDAQDTQIQNLQQELDRVNDSNKDLASTVDALNNKLQPAKVAVPPVVAPAAPISAPMAKPTTAKTEPEPSTGQVPTTKPQPVPTIPGPVTPEPISKAGKAVSKPKKARVKKLPAKDMGQAIEVPIDQEYPELPAPEGGFDFGTLSGADIAKAKRETEKVLKRVSSKKKSKQTAEIDEHGGGIGPRQHWQSLMREQGRPPMDTLNYYFPDINAQSDVEAIRAAIREIVNNPELSKTSKQRLLGQVGMMVQRNRALIGREWRQYLDRFSESVQETFAMPGTTVPRKSVIQGYTVFFNPETKTVSVTRGGDSEEAAIEQARIGTVNLKTFRNTAEKLIDRIESTDIINETIKDTASATAVIACLLTGGSLTGCATAPQQTTAQQVLKTGQDVGRTVQTAKKITRAGAEAEVNQEIRNLLRGMGGRPEELNNSNIIRIWKKIKGQPPVTPEPQAPEYGPAEPVRRPATEAKEIATKEDFIRERDRLMRMISMETDPANKQILRSAIRQLEGRAENEGWISLQQRMIRESNASGPAEQAILKRIMVSHRDLLQQYGPQKVMQAAEEVAYNVGDIAEIGSSDVSSWVDQVKQILGATA